MEAARVALSCAKTFDGVADAMDIADPELQAVRDKLAEYLDRNAIPTDAPDHDNPVTDRRICVEEGWILADVDNTGILEIQKDDDASVFETDTEAVMFVAAKAGLGVPYHCRALEVHLKTHPTDKAIIAQATAKEIRGVATSGKVSPLMKIWVTLAHGLPEDTIVLVRIGDFFETFGSDAHKMGSLANLAVSKRMGVPMCGFPVHMLTQIKKSIGAQKIAAIDVSEGWGALWPVCTIRDIRKMVPGGYYLQLTRFDRGDPTDRDFVGNVVQALEWPDTPTGRDYRLLYMRHVDPKDLMRRRVGSVERFAVWDHEVSDPKGPIHSYYFECKMP
jgi:hypothetical protein